MSNSKDTEISRYEEVQKKLITALVGISLLLISTNALIAWKVIQGTM